MIFTNACNDIELIGWCVGIFKEGTGYDLCSFEIGCFKIFVVFILHKTYPCTELVRRGVEDGLINKV